MKKLYGCPMLLSILLLIIVEGLLSQVFLRHMSLVVFDYPQYLNAQGQTLFYRYFQFVEDQRNMMTVHTYIKKSTCIIVLGVYCKYISPIFLRTACLLGTQGNGMQLFEQQKKCACPLGIPHVLMSYRHDFSTVHGVRTSCWQPVHRSVRIQEKNQSR